MNASDPDPKNQNPSGAEPRTQGPSTQGPKSAGAEQPAGRTRATGVLATVVGVVLILGGAAGVSAWIQQSEPTAQREAATRRSAALVETVTVARGTHRPSIEVLGEVRPAREIVLAPRVAGEISAVESAFRPGGIVKAGDPLLRLDPVDAAQDLIVRESELGQIRAELAIEEGQQRAAQLEFELLGEEIDPVNRSLVLREPQIEALRHRIRAAEAAVERARLDLARTEIAAPFDAQILERFVERGSQVSVGERLARLVGTDEYWVVATVPLPSLRRIHFPDDRTSGAAARIRHRAIWREGESRTGVVERLIGEVDASTRLGRVIVSVPRPLGGDDEPPLILGSVVRVEIEGDPIDDCVRLDRAHLRQGNTVWVKEDGALRVRAVEVLFADGSHAYIREGLESGDAIVTTNLATVVDGLPIREADEPDPAATEAGGGAR